MKLVWPDTNISYIGSLQKVERLTLAIPVKFQISWSIYVIIKTEVEASMFSMNEEKVNMVFELCAMLFRDKS